MAAPERFAETSDSSCIAGAVHTWHSASIRCGAEVWARLGGRQGDGNADFAIDDGSIVAKDKKDAKTTAFLISKEKYKDFQIYAEFWVSNDANSGIFIRCEDPKKPGAKTCYECNIFDTRPDPSYGTGAIVYHAEVDPMPKAGGKWSTMEITAKGRDLSIMFDGKKTASVRSGVHTEGPLALQFGEGVVKFRKVAIKPL